MTTLLIILGISIILVTYGLLNTSAEAFWGCDERDKYKADSSELQQLLQKQKEKHRRLSHLLNKPKDSRTKKEREELKELIAWLGDQ